MPPGLRECFGLGARLRAPRPRAARDGAAPGLGFRGHRRGLRGSGGLSGCCNPGRHFGVPRRELWTPTGLRSGPEIATSVH